MTPLISEEDASWSSSLSRSSSHFSSMDDDDMNEIKCPSCDEFMEVGGTCPNCGYEDPSEPEPAFARARGSHLPVACVPLGARARQQTSLKSRARPGRGM